MTISDNSVSKELSAVTILTEYLIAVASQIITLYEQSTVVFKPEDFIGLYCQFLTFIVDHKIRGDKDHLYQLIIQSIQENTEHGLHLHKTIAAHTAKEAESIHDLVKKYGLVIVPVLKLAQFITGITQVIQPATASMSEENILFESKNKTPILKIFDLNYQLALEEINSLQIANPLIFLLEHVSNTIGWLVGFFATLKQQPVHNYLEKSLMYFTESCLNGDSQKLH